MSGQMIFIVKLIDGSELRGSACIYGETQPQRQFYTLQDESGFFEIEARNVMWVRGFTPKENN